MSVVNGKNYIFFCGDFFIGEESSLNYIESLFDFSAGAPTLVNLEGAFTTKSCRTDPYKACPLRLKEGMERRIPDNVFLSLANNHSLDFGKKAFEFTKRRFRNNLASFEKSKKMFLHNSRIVFMTDTRESCKSSQLNCLDFKMSSTNDVEDPQDSIFYIHGGLEYRYYPTCLQRKIAHRLIELDAKAVIFHHSHVRGAIESYRDKFIFYGLGNFFFTEVKDLHGMAKNSGVVLRFDTENDVWAVADVSYESDYRDEHRYQFIDLNDALITRFPSDYKGFYKGEYPLDASLRPRQLDDFEIVVNIKYWVWSFCSRILLRFGLTRTIKVLLRKLAGGRFG